MLKNKSGRQRSYRKISRSLLSILPERVRLFLIRRSISVNHAWPSELLEIKIAETEEELSSAYELLHDSYVNAGFMDPNQTGLRVLVQHLLPQTTTIVAKWDGRVIGTISLIRDNPFGLPLEKIFSLDHRRFDGRRLAEVSSLAVHSDYRGQANLALFPLMRFIVQYARHYFGVDEFAIAVNPSMVDFYLSVLCFERLESATRNYDFVKGAPAVGLYLDFAKAEAKWKKIFNQKPERFNFFKYWVTPISEMNNKLPLRQYHSVSDPIMTVDLLSKFFLQKAKLAEKLTTKELQGLIDVYPFANYQKILQPLYDSLSRKSIRLETSMKAYFENNNKTFEVLNVSSGGLLIRSQNDLNDKDQLVVIFVQISNSIVTRLKVQFSRTASTNLYGLKILESSPQWKRMIDSLESDYLKKESYLKSVA